MANDYGQEPPITAIPDLRTSRIEVAVQAMKEWIEVRQGARGNPLDRAVTMRDLLNAGLVTRQAVGDLTGAPAPGATIPGTTDGAIPPTPTNLGAAGAITSVILTWDFPRTYTRLAYFEVWRSETNALAEAVVIAQPRGTIYSDVVGSEVTFYYWVRAVSDAGTSPFNAILGTVGDTPFYLQESDTEIDGIEVPEGVYLGSAWIRNGVITNAKIANLAVDDAKIASLSAEKINAGFIDAERIEAGSIDARIANLDAAVISSGFIDSARINTASIGNAMISAAQIEDATLGTAKFVEWLESAALNDDGVPVLRINFVTGEIQLNGSLAGGGRILLTNQFLRVYDENDVLRAELGELLDP